MPETKITANHIDTTIEFDFSEIAVNDGNQTTPSMSFSSDQDTGFYRSGSGDLRFSSNGTSMLFFNSSGITVNAGTGVLNQDGTAAAPSYTFGSDPDTGLYHVGANSLGFSVAGSARWKISSLGELYTDSSSLFECADGTVTAPGISFFNDPDTGMYRVSANTWGLTANGVEAIRIDGSRKIGINTTDTSQNYQMRIDATNRLGISVYSGASASAAYFFLENDGNNTWSINNNGTAATGTKPNALEFDYNGVEYMRLMNTGQLRHSDGSAATPSISFLNDSALGMYRGGSSILSFALGGAKRLELNGTAMTWKHAGNHAYIYVDRADTSSEGLVIFSTNGVNSCAIGLDNDTTERLALFTNNDLGTPKILVDTNGQTQFSSGTGASVPGISFIGDTNTGFWRSSAGTINIVTGGTNRWQIDNSGTLVSANSGASRLSIGDGTAGSPSIQFGNDPDTGFYRSGTNQLSFACGGSQIGFLDSTRGLGKVIGHAEASYNSQVSTTGTTLIASGQSITYTAKRADSLLYFFISGLASSVQNSANGAGVKIALRRDGTTDIYTNQRVQIMNAGNGLQAGGQVAVMFQTTVPDTSSHTYEVYMSLPSIGGYSGTAQWGGDGTNAGNGRLVVFEMAAL